MHPFCKLNIPEGSLGIHWFEQNAYCLQDADGYRVLTDPYFPHERPLERFCRPEPPVDEAEIPVNLVLITHRHGDHCHPETLTRIHAANPAVTVIAPYEAVEQILAETPIPLANCRVIGNGEGMALGNVAIEAFYSKPPEGDPDAGIKPPDVTHLGYVIMIEDKVVYITGDGINNLADHDELLDPIIDAEPEIGLITTHPTEGEFPFFEGAVKLAKKLGLKTVVPAHYECFCKRNYDPQPLAEMLEAQGIKPLLIPWNSSTIID